MLKGLKLALVVIGMMAGALVVPAFADTTSIPDLGSANFAWQSTLNAGTSATGTLSLDGADNILKFDLHFSSAEGLVLTGIGLDTTPELKALSDAPTGDLANFTFFGPDAGLNSSFGIALVDSSGVLTTNGGLSSGTGTVYFSLSGAQLSSILINSVNLRFTGANGGSDVLIGIDPPATSVPEPASLALLGTGLLGVSGLIRRIHSKFSNAS